LKLLKYYLLLAIILFNPIYALSEWRPYDIYRCGAKGIATGGAFTAIADDVSALYFNPAGLVQTTKFSIFYTFDTQLLIESLIQTLKPSLQLAYKVPALIGFVYPFKDKYRTTISLAAYSPFQRKIPYQFAVYKFSPVIAFEITPDLAIGFSPGLIYSSYIGISSIGKWGWGLQAGVLYSLKNRTRIGLNYHSKIKVSNYDAEETYPDILTVGTAFLLTETLICSFDIEYQNWNGIKYSNKSTSTNTEPKSIENGIFKTVHPHLGFTFLEKRSGAHIRTGISTDSWVHDDGTNDTQLLWSIGLGAYAFKIVKVEAALVDSYITHLILHSNNKIETIQITVEYRF